MTDNQAHARSTDPETSHMAADSVDVGRTKRLVMAVLGARRDLHRGPATASEVTACILGSGYRVSESGVRSRLAEMVRDGSVLVADTDGYTASGRKCRRYRLADQD